MSVPILMFMKLERVVTHLAIMWLFGLVALSLMSCGRAPKTTAADFPGTYIANFSHGSETLVLKSDGTYEQRYVPKASDASQTNAGKWDFTISPSPSITLEDVLLFDTRSNQPRIPPIRAVLGLGVRRFGNQIELIISEDEGLEYRKMPQFASPATSK